MRENYMRGVAASVVGAGQSFTSGSPEDQYLTIQVKNIPALVKQQGGGAGAVAYQLVPQTIANKVYGEMRAQFAQKLAEQGVMADVQVRSGSPTGPSASRNDILTGIAIGLLSAGAVWAVRKLV